MVHNKRVTVNTYEGGYIEIETEEFMGNLTMMISDIPELIERLQAVMPSDGNSARPQIAAYSYLSSLAAAKGISFYELVDILMQQAQRQSPSDAPVPGLTCDNCRFVKQCSLLYFPPCEQLAREAEQQAAAKAKVEVLAALNDWMIGMPESIREPIFQKIKSLCGEQEPGERK